MADRAVIKTADAERKVIQPEGLQASIDQAVKVVPLGQAVPTRCRALVTLLSRWCRNADGCHVGPCQLCTVFGPPVLPPAAGRSFVRPSGTEDVVRVYAEAHTQQQADDLAKQVACFVSEQAGAIS